MDDVECDGSEASLLSCPHSQTDDCSGHEGAGAVCFNDIKLEGGKGPEEGNLMWKSQTRFLGFSEELE